jgi:hypothetical protein
MDDLLMEVLSTPVGRVPDGAPGRLPANKTHSDKGFLVSKQNRCIAKMPGKPTIKAKVLP